MESVGTEENYMDSKVKNELDCLNSTSEKINELENAINEKRSQYRFALTSSTQSLNSLAQKLGDCIAKARPYYEAKRVAKNAHNEAQQAALKFERAVSMHTAAREMVTVAERGMINDPKDSAWAEMLNHATLKVNEAETERYQSEVNHQVRAEAFKTAEENVKKLQKKLKSNIKKSHQYFEMKKITQQTLETVTESVNDIQAELKQLKELYSNTLQNLEKISDEIHATRKSHFSSDSDNETFFGQRQEGVGAEDPFNQQEIMKELKKDFGDNASKLSVLNDLKKSDSVDMLNNISENTSFEYPSCSSTTSSLSRTSSNDYVESLKSCQLKDEKIIGILEPSNGVNGDEHKSIQKVIKKSTTRETAGETNLIKVPSLTNKSLVLSSKAANKPHGDGEIVLSVAGLGEVSELNS